MSSSGTVLNVERLGHPVALGSLWRGHDIQWHRAQCGEAMTSSGTVLVVERP